MSDPRIAAVIGAVESRYPGIRLEAEPWGTPEDPAIRWFLWILQFPEGRGAEIQAFALRRAHELFGEDPLPFFVAPAGPVQAAKPPA